MADASKGKKGSRRDYGDGSIYQRKDGRFTGSFRPPDGKRKYVYADTRQGVKKLLEEAKQQAQAGMLVKISHQRMAEYLEYWLSVHKLTIRASTYVQYYSHIHTQIVPTLGKILLQKLAMQQVQRFVAKMSESGLEPTSIRMTHAILNRALKDAIEWGMLVTNPCKGVRLPRIEQQEMQTLDEQQAQAFLKSLQGHELECLVTVALATGMRRGELLALKWGDVDLVKGIVSVRRTLVYINGEGFRETEPKTRTSKRAISLAGFAIEALKSHRVKQAEIRLKTGAGWKKQNLVFPNKIGGYIATMTLHQHFKKVLAQAGLPEEMHLHTLRHSAATLLLKMNVPPKVVQEILGHSSIKITMDVYGHILPGMQNSAMNALDTMMTGSKKEAT